MSRMKLLNKKWTQNQRKGLHMPAVQQSSNVCWRSTRFILGMPYRGKLRHQCVLNSGLPI